MTRHAIHVKYARSLAVRGIDKLVVGHMYQQMHWPYADNPDWTTRTFHPRPKPLLAFGFIGHDAEQGLRHGYIRLSMGVVQAPRSTDSVQRIRLVWPAWSRLAKVDLPTYDLWFASDAGVEPYPSGYNEQNFLLDMTDLGQRGIRLVGDSLDHSAF